LYCSRTRSRSASLGILKRVIRSIGAIVDVWIVRRVRIIRVGRRDMGMAGFKYVSQSEVWGGVELRGDGRHVSIPSARIWASYWLGV
jgi:hypothetical protein